MSSKALSRGESTGIFFDQQKEEELMKKLATLLSLCSLVFFTVACVTHEAKIQKSGARLLTQADLEAIFSNEVTFDFLTANQGRGSTTYKPDGTCKVSGNNFSDTGTYWIENGQYCSKWDNIRKSTTCQRWYKIGDQEFHQVDSAGNLSAKMYLK
jgi:hypothetical protein